MDLRARSWAKSISWRVLGILLMPVIILVVYNTVGQTAGALALWATIIFHSIRVVLYYFHERVWLRIKWGCSRGKVLWFTGLSGAGKSTIVEAAAKRLRGRGYKVQILDGDQIRSKFPGTGFSKIERDAHILRVGYMAALLEAHGVIVLCSFISPYRSTRNRVREMCSDFCEIHVNAALGTCIQRDPKGLYRKALAGEIKEFTGLSAPYEPPVAPELRLRTDNKSETLAACVRKVLSIV